jgi:hypothetical protein
MSPRTSTVSLYPPGGFGAPKDRHGHADGINVGLPEGTVVFSADNHISLADDIFYQRFPEALKDKAPRIWYEDGAYQVGRKGQSFLPGDFSAVLMQYDDLPGAASTNIEARIQELREDGVEKELAFPNAILALFHYPDKELRELAFRIYNEYIAELQERSNGHFYGAGLINWWDPEGTKRTLAELKSLGLKTFLLPLNPGKDDEGNVIDYSSTGMKPVWDEIEAAGLPVTHHIGETPPKSPCQFNSVVVGMMINIDGFREQFAKYLFSGILDDHPGLQDRLVRGWNRLGALGFTGRGAPGGVIPAHVQSAAGARRALLLGHPHECVVHGRPAGPAVDRPDRHRQGDVVQRLSAQRKHIRLFGEVVGRCRRLGRR